MFHCLHYCLLDCLSPGAGDAPAEGGGNASQGAEETATGSAEGHGNRETAATPPETATEAATATTTTTTTTTTAAAAAEWVSIVRETAKLLPICWL